ncbi:MAG: restriction endonuclease [Nitrososphaerales archaeon]|nr:restriction endonuclease [Nitrososphaerales archaeon]
MPDLLSLLTRKVGSPAKSMELLKRNRESLGVDCEPTDPGLMALSLCSAGFSSETVSSLLTWREFEAFSANLLRASGYEVRENVRLLKPRAQIDLVALGPSVILSVDCKHWRRGTSRSALAKFARDQLKRNMLLRRTLSDSRPVVSVILTLTEQGERFVDGVAVVPLHTLRSFLDSVDEYMDVLASF